MRLAPAHFVRLRAQRKLKEKVMDDLRCLSGEIIGAALAVHKELGPGLLESVYKSCLGMELLERGIPFQTEVPLPIIYRDRVLSESFRIDMLVDDRVIVELKSVSKIQAVHVRQLLTYLRLAKRPLGLLMNFNEVLLKDGITRLANSPACESRNPL